MRGLRTKTNKLLLALSLCDYDVIALTETWLHHDIRNSELTHNYAIYRCDRNTQTSQHRRGGGVLIAVKNEFRSTAVCVADSDQLEQVIVRISLEKFDLIACCVYLPPNSEPALYELHAQCVQKLVDEESERNLVLIVGDYNLPHLSWVRDECLNCMLPINASSEQGMVLVESVLSTGLFQINNVTNFNGRLLDLAFINDSSRVVLLEPPLPLLPIDQHHRPFAITFEVAYDERDDFNVTSPLNFDFNRCDFELLNRLFAETRWEEILSDCNADDAVVRFYEHVYDILRGAVPTKQQFGQRVRKQPWWNNQLQHLRNRLRKARKKFFRWRDERHKAELRDIESEYNSLHAHCFRCYIRRVEYNIKHDPASFWAYIRNRKQQGGIPQRVRYLDTAAETPLEAANLFSSFFRTVQSTNLPPSSEEYLSSLPLFDLNMPLFNFSLNDVTSKLRSIDGSKSAGPDRRRLYFLKTVLRRSLFMHRLFSTYRCRKEISRVCGRLLLLHLYIKQVV